MNIDIGYLVELTEPKENIRIWAHSNGLRAGSKGLVLKSIYPYNEAKCMFVNDYGEEIHTVIDINHIKPVKSFYQLISEQEDNI